ncbi:MAG: L-serine ammonia-lyase, iron-sulfur-dependent, subunit alpha [Desulfobacterales bacterium]|nr:L-serine ammonia-lyase, iron-sulfur-dependent, subunit alpha [Desulfobacterales bacterium]MDX2508497.1 L-serine ammonia-lyase, iron-sulfur-dependent, subunit alpha [Desulfobacterales bacterium]
MNILKEVLKHEVFPALGCTEPIAVAHAASIAAHEIDGDIEEISITVDPGVYKNGFAVIVPNTGGEKGNLIAGVLGALIKKPELKMEVLKDVKEEMIGRAKALIRAKKAKISYDSSKTDLYIEVFLKTKGNSSRAVIENAHTNLVRLEKNNQTLFEKKQKESNSAGKEHKAILKEMKISELIDLAQHMDDEDYDYIKRGIEMNLKISKAGQKLEKVGYYIFNSVNRGCLVNDVYLSSKILTASAADARMAGIDLPAMSSGGSGNQGIVSILVPYNAGKIFKIEEKIILQSIALSHLINSYIKCFTGDLSPLCGCATAAGVCATAAIVYQQCGNDMEKITLAVNSLISDLGGMLCDGAKGGCALKVATATDSAIRCAYMALDNYGISNLEGFVGKTAEETIRNLSKISILGMSKVDETILGIMLDKTL